MVYKSIEFSSLAMLKHVCIYLGNKRMQRCRSKTNCFFTTKLRMHDFRLQSYNMIDDSYDQFEVETSGFETKNLTKHSTFNLGFKKVKKTF